jgi:hypothetical protein
MATSVYSWFRINFTTSLFGCLALGFFALFISNTIYLSILVLTQLVLLFVGLRNQLKLNKQNLADEKLKLTRFLVDNTGKPK